MEKKWFPQQSKERSVIALLNNLIYNFNIGISRYTILSETKKHPNFPNLSFQDLISHLQNWNITAALFHLNPNDLSRCKEYTVFNISETTPDGPETSYVLFYEVKGNTVEYLHTRKGWVKENIDLFTHKMSNQVLYIKSVPETPEINFEIKENTYVHNLNSNPALKYIKVFDNYINEDDCRYIINISQERFKNSELMDEKNIVAYGRNSRTADLVLPEDPVLSRILKKVANNMEIPESHFEFFQCVSYEAGQEYQNHHDTFNEESDRGKKEIQERGQREHTLLVYLNDEFYGGGTHFPYLDMVIKPKRGRVVVFQNIDEKGKVIPASLHAGLPVQEGRKYALNIWVRTKPFRTS